MERKVAWNEYDEEGRNNVFDFAKKYTKFISDCKTERECVKETVALAKKAGYKDLNDHIKKNKRLNSIRDNNNIKEIK